jgi:hypothetical protein
MFTGERDPKLSTYWLAIHATIEKNASEGEVARLMAELKDIQEERNALYTDGFFASQDQHLNLAWLIMTGLETAYHLTEDIK